MPRRLVLAFAAVLVIGAGLSAHFVGGEVADFAGDVLYAALIYLLVALCFGRPRPVLTAAMAFGLCVVVEFFQLTGLPAALWAVFPPIELVLGANFSIISIIAYGIGALIVLCVDVAVVRFVAPQPARGA